MCSGSTLFLMLIKKKLCLKHDMYITVTLGNFFCESKFSILLAVILNSFLRARIPCKVVVEDID